MTIKDLQPKVVWNNFYGLTRVPRPSKHEEKVIEYLDSITPEAQSIGAVNVIRVTHEGKKIKLKGYNSDVIGFTKSIEPMLDKKWHQKAIKTELIFEKVAHEEGLKVEDESLKKYIDSSVQNYGFSSEEDLYNSFGNGNSDEGKVYIERLYLINTAIDLVVKNANIKEQA